MSLDAHVVRPRLLRLIHLNAMKLDMRGDGLKKRALYPGAFACACLASLLMRCR